MCGWWCSECLYEWFVCDDFHDVVFDVIIDVVFDVLSDDVFDDVFDVVFDVVFDAVGDGWLTLSCVVRNGVSKEGCCVLWCERW